VRQLCQAKNQHNCLSKPLSKLRSPSFTSPDVASLLSIYFRVVVQLPKAGFTPPSVVLTGCPGARSQPATTICQLLRVSPHSATSGLRPGGLINDG